VTPSAPTWTVPELREQAEDFDALSGAERYRAEDFVEWLRLDGARVGPRESL
jgi:hypothetical protein